MSLLVLNFLSSLNQTQKLDLRYKRFIGENFCEENEIHVGGGKETPQDAVQVQHLYRRGEREKS